MRGFHKTLKTLRSTDGFTLIEMLVVASVMAVIATGMAGFMYYQQRQAKSVEESQAISSLATSIAGQAAVSGLNTAGASLGGSGTPTPTPACNPPASLPIDENNISLMCKVKDAGITASGRVSQSDYCSVLTDGEKQSLQSVLAGSSVFQWAHEVNPTASSPAACQIVAPNNMASMALSSSSPRYSMTPQEGLACMNDGITDSYEMKCRINGQSLECRNSVMGSAFNGCLTKPLVPRPLAVTATAVVATPQHALAWMVACAPNFVLPSMSLTQFFDIWNDSSIYLVKACMDLYHSTDHLNVPNAALFNCATQRATFGAYPSTVECKPSGNAPLHIDPVITCPGCS